MRQIFLAVTAFLLLHLLPAQAQDNPIAKRMAEFQVAYNAKDGAAIALFYTEDGAVLPPRASAIVGREKIATHFAQAFNSGVASLDYKILEIRQVGPAAAVEIGEARIKIKDATILSRSMHVWFLSEGTWLLNRDMYHVLGPVK